MKKSFLKESATSLTALIFLVVGITGVMMYFHILDKYTEALHENLGLAFVVVAVLHVFYNWSSMKRYFPKKLFHVFSVIVLVVSLAFIVSVKEGENPKKTIIHSTLKAPLAVSSALFGKDVAEVIEVLKVHNLQVSKGSSLDEIAKENKISPFEIVDMISKK